MRVLIILLIVLIACEASTKEDEVIEYYKLDFLILDETENYVDSARITLMSADTILVIYTNEGIAETGILKNQKYQLIIELDSVLLFEDVINEIRPNVRFTTQGGLNISPSFKDGNYIYYLDLTIPNYYKLKGKINSDLNNVNEDLLLYLHNYCTGEIIDSALVSPTWNFDFSYQKSDTYYISTNTENLGFVEFHEIFYCNGERILNPEKVSKQIHLRNDLDISLDLFSAKNYFPNIELDEVWKFKIFTNRGCGDCGTPDSKRNYHSTWQFYSIEIEGDRTTYRFTETIIDFIDNEERGDTLQFDRYLFIDENAIGSNVFNKVFFFNNWAQDWVRDKVEYGPEIFGFEKDYDIIYRDWGPPIYLRLIEGNWFDEIRYRDSDTITYWSFKYERTN